MNGYMTAQEAAIQRGVTPRQAQIPRKENRITESSRMGRIWVIPENTKRLTKDSSTGERKKDDKP